MSCKYETEWCRNHVHCQNCIYHRDEYIVGATTSLTEEVTINQLLEVIKQFNEFLYEETSIFVGNPLYLVELDMYEFPSNCYFVSSPYVPKDEIYEANGDWKRFWLEFIKEHPDKVFRGKKF